MRAALKLYLYALQLAVIAEKPEEHAIVVWENDGTRDIPTNQRKLAPLIYLPTRKASTFDTDSKTKPSRKIELRNLLKKR